MQETRQKITDSSADAVDWLHSNGHTIAKLQRRRPNLDGRDILAAACRVYEFERHTIRPIRIAWRIWELASNEVDLESEYSTNTMHVFNRLDEIEYLLWKMNHPYMALLDGTFTFGSW